MTLFDDSLRCPSVMTLRDISRLYFAALFRSFISRLYLTLSLTATFIL